MTVNSTSADSTLVTHITTRTLLGFGAVSPHLQPCLWLVWALCYLLTFPALPHPSLFIKDFCMLYTESWVVCLCASPPHSMSVTLVENLGMSMTPHPQLFLQHLLEPSLQQQQVMQELTKGL